MSESNCRQLDAACRILTLSSSLTGAKDFIKRLKALSIQDQSSTSASSADAKTSEEGDTIIPWTIVNRYYIADVYFSAHVIHGITPMMFDKPHTPPAVIYVWVDGESYVKHIEELSRMMGGYEPEVCLAVRIPKSDETTGLVEDHSEGESNTDIDTVLMSYGFEYIDATRQVPLRQTGEVEDELSSTVDIPHLPRVLDALSTIMWPSMKSGHKGSTGGEFDNKSRRQRDLILEELLLPYGHGTMPLSANHRESDDEDDVSDLMQELKSKCISDTTKIDEGRVPKVSREGTHAGNALPWLTINSGNTGDGVFSPLDRLLSSPFDTGSSTPFGIKDQPKSKFSIGFEDDFTAFVSAPAVDLEEGEITPDANGYYKQHDSPMPSAIQSGSLEPGSANSARYQSLGSDFGGSDFGDEEPLYESFDDGGDEDLPTKEEIRETSGKIFGKVVAGTPLGTSIPDPSDDEERAPFDLSQVMDVLQQFKTEISGMDDEEERRKAAAKVALGLVYGLEN